MRTAAEEVGQILGCSGIFPLQINKQVPLCIFTSNPPNIKTTTTTTQVKARGADLIIITDNPKLARGLVPDPIVIPSNGPLTALIATLPLQLLAYELAILKVGDGWWMMETCTYMRIYINFFKKN